MDILSKETIYLSYILALTVLWRLSGHLIRQYLVKTTTALCDISNLGRPRPEDMRIKGTAVVCGGSFAGLWSARFLADHFEDVLIVEPEEWLSTSEGTTPIYNEDGDEIEGSRMHGRTRVFQYELMHAFQPLTYKALKMLYPFVDEEIRKLGGRVGKSDFPLFFFGKKLSRTTKGEDGRYIQNFHMSRESVERLLRRLILRNTPRIRWMTGTVKDVEGDLSVLSSVVVRLPDNSETRIPAALVADCTGPTQAGLKWLNRLGTNTDKRRNGRLALDDPKLRLSYCPDFRTRTFYFYLPPDLREKIPVPGGYERLQWVWAFMPLHGKGRKAGFADRVEGHRLRIMVVTFGELPLPEVDELKDFFVIDFNPIEKVSDWFLDVLDVLQEVRDRAEYVTTKYPSTSWIRYEKAAQIPSNFVAVGDAVMQVNPAFGQGCSKALIGAAALDSILRSRSTVNSTTVPVGFGPRYFREQAKKTAVAWEGTKPIDYLFPATTPVEGEKRRDGHLAAKYLISVMVLSLTDERINDVFYRVLNFLGAPGELMKPHILAKVLLLWARERLGLATDPLRD